jgi:hypothetical protein
MPLHRVIPPPLKKILQKNVRKAPFQAAGIVVAFQDQEIIVFN